MAGTLHALAWAKQVKTGANGEPLTPTEKLALLILADYLNAETGYAWPSIATIAADCLVTDRHAQKVLRSLEAKGLITVQERYGKDGRQMSSAYRLLIGSIPAPDLPPVDPDPETVAPVTANEIRSALVSEVLPAMLDDFPDKPVDGYRACLEAADVLAADNPGVSKDLRGFLRNAVLVEAARDSHDLEPSSKGTARLLKEGRVLGHEWLVVALFQTASADIKGDPTSYIIKVARNLKAERQGVAA
jgi:hypothetical protein